MLILLAGRQDGHPTCKKNPKVASSERMACADTWRLQLSVNAIFSEDADQIGVTPVINTS